MFPARLAQGDAQWLRSLGHAWSPVFHRSIALRVGLYTGITFRGGVATGVWAAGQLPNDANVGVEAGLVEVFNNSVGGRIAHRRGIVEGVGDACSALLRIRVVYAMSQDYRANWGS